MKWSLKLGRFAGIDVFVHWTFAILLVWIFLGHLSAGQDTIAALKGIGFILALFSCVVLHEFGHALTARRYGIRTRDITLLPIGGIARLERMPEDPMQELWVALAGPAVNVIIAAILFGIMAAVHGLPGASNVELVRGDFVARLMWVNVTLIAFNILPAFPMDGGRILRALLAKRIGRRRATHVAAAVGQGMAILFGIIGLLYNPFLLFIALFVYLGAQAEAQMVELSSVIRGLKVRDAMQTRFRTLSVDDPLRVAVDELLAGAQQDFPVVGNGQVLGMLRRKDLVKALAEQGREVRVADAMCHDCPTVYVDHPLERTLEKLRESDCAAVPVMSGDEMVGLLTLENISELVMVHAALENRGAKRGS
ncbi:MAG: site-2 protease family protein [Verrucomicrobiales bacterium]|nr:site-2 protease family protein [Verrucomicrobiales bacterium]